MPSVTTEIISRHRVPEQDLLAMLQLHRQSFARVDEAKFRADLDEKDWVIALRDASGLIVGFSTQRLVSLELEGTTHRFLFSGDTVVERTHRRQTGLAGAFGHLMLRLIELHGEDKLYWFLISKGFRTYRFLPVFFRRFHPDPLDDTGQAGRLRPLLDGVATWMFGPAYAPDRGVVTLDTPTDRLCGADAEVPPSRRRDAYIRFFLDANPEWCGGVELACLAPIRHDNLNDSALRVIARTHPRWLE